MTVACGTTAPDGSVMRPRTVPVGVCAAAAAVMSRRKRERKATIHAEGYSLRLARPPIGKCHRRMPPSPPPSSLFVINKLDRKRRQILPLIGLIGKLFY